MGFFLGGGGGASPSAGASAGASPSGAAGGASARGKEDELRCAKGPVAAPAKALLLGEGVGAASRRQHRESQAGGVSEAASACRVAVRPPAKGTSPPCHGCGGGCVGRGRPMVCSFFKI